jgi:hypothetical protein
MKSLDKLEGYTFDGECDVISGFGKFFILETRMRRGFQKVPIHCLQERPYSLLEA